MSYFCINKEPGEKCRLCPGNRVCYLVDPDSYECPKCEGKRIFTRQGMMEFINTPCSKCNGKGRIKK